MWVSVSELSFRQAILCRRNQGKDYDRSFPYQEEDSFHSEEEYFASIQWVEGKIHGERHVRQGHYCYSAMRGVGWTVYSVTLLRLGPISGGQWTLVQFNSSSSTHNMTRRWLDSTQMTCQSVLFIYCLLPIAYCLFKYCLIDIVGCRSLVAQPRMGSAIPTPQRFIQWLRSKSEPYLSRSSRQVFGRAVLEITLQLKTQWTWTMMKLLSARIRCPVPNCSTKHNDRRGSDGTPDSI